MCNIKTTKNIRSLNGNVWILICSQTAEGTGFCSRGYKKLRLPAKLCSTDCIMPSYCSQAFRESTHVENNRSTIQSDVERSQRSLWCKSILTCSYVCKLKALTLRGLHVCKREFSYNTDQCISTGGPFISGETNHVIMHS